MTISTKVSKVSYAGNDIATSFAYTYKIFQDEDLEVVLTDVAGVETPLVLNTDYTVTGAGEDSGGNVLYPISGDPLATGETLTINRLVDLTQLIDFEEQGAFSAESIENGFDTLTMQTQQIQEQLDRCPKVDLGSGETGDDLLDQIDQSVIDSAASATDSANSAAASAASAAAAAVSETNAATSAAEAAISASNLGDLSTIGRPGTSLQALANKKATLATKEYVDSQPNTKISKGELNFIATNASATDSKGVWSTGKFLLVADGSQGLRSYLKNNDGTLTLVDTDFQSNIYTSVWGDGNYIYVTALDAGLMRYLISDTGILSFVDTATDYLFYNSVWGDGTFIYATSTGEGLLSYKIDENDDLIFVDNDDQGGDYQQVWGDGTFIYIANGSDGLRTYSVNQNGILTAIDVDDQGDDYQGVWGDGRFIYCACGAGGLRTYTVNNTGTLTFVDSDFQAGDYQKVWGDGKFIYVSCGTDGLRVYSVDSTGTLTHLDVDDQGGTYQGIYGDGEFIYTAIDSGIVSYSLNDAYEYVDTTQRHQFEGLLGCPKLTTTERDALTAANGDSIYNTTTDKFQDYENGAWVDRIVTQTSYYNFCSSQLLPYNHLQNYSRGNGNILSAASLALADVLFVGTFHLPQGATITNLKTGWYRDDPLSTGSFVMYRYGILGGLQEQMAATPANLVSGDFFVEDNSPTNNVIDNSAYQYFCELILSPYDFREDVFYYETVITYTI